MINTSGISYKHYTIMSKDTLINRAQEFIYSIGLDLEITIDKNNGDIIISGDENYKKEFEKIIIDNDEDLSKKETVFNNNSIVSFAYPSLIELIFKNMGYCIHIFKASDKEYKNNIEIIFEFENEKKNLL